MQDPAQKSRLLSIGGATIAAALIAGCQTPDEAPAEGITFNEVAPIIYEKCASCHRPGESAPFALVDYDDVERRAVQLSRVVRALEMPP